MSVNSERVKAWRKRLKLHLISGFGGKCTCCGYNRHQSALEFHHIDPTKKDFGVSDSSKITKSWSKVIEEVKKCVLVCSNCHREIHAGIIEIPIDYQQFSEELSGYVPYATLKGNKNNRGSIV